MISRCAVRSSLQFSTIIDDTLWDISSISNILPSFCYAQRFSKIFPSTFYHCTIIEAILQDLLSNFLPFCRRWCYAPRSSARYWRHGWYMVCHTVLSIRGGRGALWNTTYPTCKLEKRRLSSKTDFFKMPALLCISTSMQHAATHSHLQPLTAACSHLQPLAATRLAANGCKRWHKRKK